MQSCMPSLKTLLSIVQLAWAGGKLVYETVDEMRQEAKREAKELAAARKKQSDDYRYAANHAGHEGRGK
jgi:hypothetical protein